MKQYKAADTMTFSKLLVLLMRLKYCSYINCPLIVKIMCQIFYICSH